MEQLMRNYHGLAFVEARPSHTFANLTPTSRANTYGRKSAAALLRIEEMRTDMARRQVAQIESAIADLDQTARALEHEIEIEHNRTGIRDPGHIAYSMYAKATIARRDNLKRTITELKGRLAVAKISLAEVSHDAQKCEYAWSFLWPSIVASKLPPADFCNNIGPGLNRAGVAFMIPELVELRTRGDQAGRTEGDPQKTCGAEANRRR
jgi:flagellar FliJ protein